MPRDVGDHMARPAAFEPAIDHLAHGVIPPLRGRDGGRQRARRLRHRLLGEGLGEPPGIAVGILIGIGLQALPKRPLHVGRRDLTAVELIMEVGRRQEHLAVADIPQQLPGVEEASGGETQEGIHGHVVLQRPEGRNQGRDLTDRSMHLLELRRTGDGITDRRCGRAAGDERAGGGGHGEGSRRWGLATVETRDRDRHEKLDHGTGAVSPQTRAVTWRAGMSR